TNGAKQLVVQLALEIMLCLAGSYSFSLTPMTMVLTSPLPGAEIITFLAPACKCPAAFSLSVKRPVDSITISTPKAFQGSSAGDLVAITHLVLCPLTTNVSFSVLD